MLWVEVSPYLIRKASARWGIPDSEERVGVVERPTLDDFVEGPLEAAVFFCERGFDGLRPESPGSPIKLVVLPRTGLFPLTVFYAMEIVSPVPSRRFVELLDYTLDAEPPP